MDWFTQPILIAPWVIYLMAAGCAAFGFAIASAFISGKRQDEDRQP